MNFPAWIAAQVERHGSLVTFAAVVGVDPTVAGDWRRGHCYPRPDMVERLAVATGASEAWLIALVHEGRKTQAHAIRASIRKPLARIDAPPTSTVRRHAS